VCCCGWGHHGVAARGSPLSGVFHLAAQQGDAVRIMFIHVPAWLAMFCYMLIALCPSIGLLIWRHPLATAAALRLNLS
jgi:ABC-type transport system involved in cytochrome c biogenesis permease subunit